MTALNLIEVISLDGVMQGFHGTDELSWPNAQRLEGEAVEGVTRLKADAACLRLEHVGQTATGIVELSYVTER
jgi:hypothetical protein